MERVLGAQSTGLWGGGGSLREQREEAAWAASRSAGPLTASPGWTGCGDHTQDSPEPCTQWWRRGDGG